ncbi:MAG: transposase, partial [Candidatus Marinimicrobia bacterium]|nr:transposase [Candidatus Neomarinimicrobiota bacterium]
MRDQVSIPSQLRVRKHLNADALFASLKRIFNKIPDHRTGDVKVSLSDALMSGFAMFSLKDPSLLAFDERRKKENGNLCSIYGVNEIPSDTRMREILDEVLSEHMFSAYKVIFRALQR